MSLFRKESNFRLVDTWLKFLQNTVAWSSVQVKKTKSYKVVACYFHWNVTRIQLPCFTPIPESKQTKNSHYDLAATQVFDKMHPFPNDNLIIPDYDYLDHPTNSFSSNWKNIVFLALIWNFLHVTRLTENQNWSSRELPRWL